MKTSKQTTKQLVARRPPRAAELYLRLYNYLRDRHRLVGIKFELPNVFYLEARTRGDTQICGVQISDDRMLSDAAEPQPGFFVKWMAEHPS